MENDKPHDISDLSLGFLVYHLIFFVFDFSKNLNQTDRFLVKIGFVGFCEN
jgi:hypothetical protein